VVSRLSHWLNRITEVICSFILLAMVLVVTLQVICRYLLGSSLTWSEELARYSLVWLTFLGAGIAMKRGAHMGLQILEKALSQKAQRLTKLVSLLSISSFLGLAAFEGFQLALFNMKQHSPAIGVPMGAVYLAIPTGTLIMLVHAAHELIAIWRHEPIGRPGGNG
jgi:TRAP-type C4-dicarboxylate transport system permease small subunit